ncbi:mycothiol-dependent nitroreductase Rv2466c family protein [Amycolatopsis eburnea]|uniref:Disulfide bond formation protein DsbA n=1 Tax=Amycolatopsis eburnea TaxID=2267691 RepID=A0A3R9DS70_9PSEU|nr:DsbA family protein [Amycolatopsis eburnea]RSD10765.1 disulfide bond formation protein DsbA [Amycolatopsis eburnea]
MKTVEQWFDPMDPWSWVVSRWLLEVEQVREIDLRFRVMSVSVVNADREIPEQYLDDPEAYLKRMQAAWGPVRVATAAAEQLGPKVLRDLYTALGTRIHEQGNKDFPAVISAALDELGLPAELNEVATTDAADDQVRASTREAMDAVGIEIGTPIIRIDGAAFFGPVVSKIARGEDAGRLFDALATLAGFEHVSEIKRARISEPDFS